MKVRPWGLKKRVTISSREYQDQYDYPEGGGSYSLASPRLSFKMKQMNWTTEVEKELKYLDYVDVLDFCTPYVSVSDIMLEIHDAHNGSYMVFSGSKDELFTYTSVENFVEYVENRYGLEVGKDFTFFFYPTEPHININW